MLLSQFRVGVVGASIAGLSVANVLTRAGAQVAVFERGASPSVNAAAVSVSRSISAGPSLAPMRLPLRISCMRVGGCG